jgi:acyltransferase
MIQTERYDFVDIAKGIGIILVVWSHMSTTAELADFFKWGGYMTTFYMPLFFILSGLFYRPSNMKKRLKQLLVPYIVFYVLAYLDYMVKCILKQENIEWNNFLVPFLGGTIGYRNSPIWFLLSLSQVSVLAAIFVKYMNKIVALPFSLLLAFAASYSKLYFSHIPYYMDVSLVCFPFFLIGYYYREEILHRLNAVSVCILVVLSAILYILSPEFTNVSQNYLPQGYVLFFMVSVMASLGIIGFCKYIHGKVSLLLQFFGKNSLIILCSHMMFITLGSIHIPYVPTFIMNILGLVTILGVEYFIIRSINKHSGWMLGRSN